MNPKNLSQRLKTVQQKLRQKKIEALFVTDAFNVRYLTDFTGTNGQIILTPRKAFFITDFRYLSVAKKILPPKVTLINMKEGLTKTLLQISQKAHIKNLHFEEGNLSFLRYRLLKKNLKKIKFIPSQGLIEGLRMIKDDQELAYIIKAQRIAEKVFKEVRKNLKSGKTEKDIAREIEDLGRQYGAENVSFPSIVGFKQNSASPHHQNSDLKLKKGDMVLIDMGMQYKGYCSDMTRMIFTAKPTEHQRKIYNTVLEAQEKSIKILKSGIKGSTVDTCARDIIAKAGYGETFGHSLGHGIGLEVHESPTLSTGYHETIPENTIVTVEPGIYLENSFGVRIEDMLLVKRHKALNLTRIPKEIESSIFPIS